MNFEEFRNTRREMTGAEFGELVQDLAWEDTPDARLYVYIDVLNIELDEEGKPFLVIGNTTDHGPLPALEWQLYRYAIDEEMIPRSRFEPTMPTAAEVHLYREGYLVGLKEAKHAMQQLAILDALHLVRADGTLEDKVEWLLNRFEEEIIEEIENS